MALYLQHGSAGLRPRRVFLAIPSYGNPGGLLTFSLFRAHPELLEAGFDVHLGLLIGDCHVDDARNRLVADFLATDCEDLVFLDSDIGFHASDLIKLLNYDRDVVGGAYPKKSDVPQYPVWLMDRAQWAEADGLLEVMGLCTGFLRIRRHVLEKLSAASHEYVGASGEPAREVFVRDTFDGVRHSGDINFCRRWREMGGQVFVDPTLYLEHRGDKTWSGTLGAHLRCTAGLSMTAALARIGKGTELDSDYMDLVTEWGNDPWSAGPELVKAAVMVARQVKGAVLETGSGLTTLAMAAANPALTIHSLEHQKEWAAKVEGAAERLGLTNIVVHCAPLREYPAGRWYAIPKLPWNDIDLVLCDGPPRQEGNRRILFGVMATHDCSPRCVLVDDAETEGDAVPPEYRTEIKGQYRKFAVGLRN